MILVSMYDKKARAFFKPFTSATHDTAIRELTVLARNPESDLSKYPDDFDAVVVGEFSEVHGVLTPCAHVILSIPRVPAKLEVARG